ncbi:MAG: ATP-binding cassette domain-containing protein [Variovorax sp.]|nr:MAG: ATP-binding cassette domain-containing protein [Variovorax sp.]
MHFAYPDQPPIANGWTCAIGPGVTHLFGDTGSGKSTLLRVLAGALPASGQLRLNGVRLDRDPVGYRAKVFWCDPITDAFDAMTGRACTAALGAGDSGFDDAAWQALVEGFGLAPHIDKPMFMLSTGSKRKVWLAAALASARPLTLLDDPVAALDAPSVRCLWQALVRSAQTRPDRAIVIASSEPLVQVPLAASITLPPG